MGDMTKFLVPVDDETMATAEQLAAETGVPIALLISGTFRKFCLHIRETGHEVRVVPIGTADGGNGLH